MSAPGAVRVLLIDLDNCPKQLRHLPDALAGFAKVVACHGGADPKVSLTLLPFLAGALNAGKLEMVRMKKGGPNAADFGLAFWAGRLLEQMPEAEFVIFSGDRDLDHVVHLLQAAGRIVERLDGNRFVPVVVSLDRSPPPAAIEATVEDRAREYQKLHLGGRSGRPARRATLLNSIRAFCKDHPGADPEAVLLRLIERGHLSLDPVGRVIYGPRPSVREEPLAVAEDDIPF